MTKKRTALVFGLLLIMSTTAFAQGQASKATLEQKRQRLYEIDSNLEELNQKIKSLTEERSSLTAIIAQEDNERAFLDSPLRKVVEVGEQSIVILIEGRKREMRLAGIIVRSNNYEEVQEYLAKELSLGLVYVRCSEPLCDSAYLYLRKENPSLNVQIVRKGWATLAQGAALDLATPSEQAVEPNKRPVQSTPSSSGSVQVKGYYRKDGTYVRPHTRGAPKRKP